MTNGGWLLYLDIDIRSAASSLGQRFSNTKQQISLVTCGWGGVLEENRCFFVLFDDSSSFCRFSTLLLLSLLLSLLGLGTI